MSTPIKRTFQVEATDPHTSEVKVYEVYAHTLEEATSILIENCLFPTGNTVEGG